MALAGECCGPGEGGAYEVVSVGGAMIVVIDGVCRGRCRGAVEVRCGEVVAMNVEGLIQQEGRPFFVVGCAKTAC